MWFTASISAFLVVLLAGIPALQQVEQTQIPLILTEKPESQQFNKFSQSQANWQP
jgi:hypothetical protein